MYRLLDKLQPGQPVEAQSNAAEILAALAQSQVSPLTCNLADPAFLELLVERALRSPEPAAAAPAAADAAEQPAGEAAAAGGEAGAKAETAGEAPAGSGASAEASAPAAVPAAANGDATAAAAEGGGAAQQPSAEPEVAGAAAPAAAAAQGSASGGSSSAMYHALNVCIALVEPLPPSLAEQQAAAQGLGLGGGMPTPAVDAAAAEVHTAMQAQATQCISRSIDRLVALLDAEEPGRQLPTSYGLLQPPVGLARLKAVELLAALLHTGDEVAGASEAASVGGHAAAAAAAVPAS